MSCVRVSLFLTLSLIKGTLIFSSCLESKRSTSSPTSFNECCRWKYHEGDCPCWEPCSGAPLRWSGPCLAIHPLGQRQAIKNVRLIRMRCGVLTRLTQWRVPATCAWPNAKCTAVHAPWLATAVPALSTNGGGRGDVWQKADQGFVCSCGRVSCPASSALWAGSLWG